MIPQVAKTIRPQVRETHNEVYLSAFVERCKLQGWTTEQIEERVRLYMVNSASSIPQRRPQIVELPVQANATNGDRLVVDRQQP